MRVYRSADQHPPSIKLRTIRISIYVALIAILMVVNMGPFFLKQELLKKNISKESEGVHSLRLKKEAIKNTLIHIKALKKELLPYAQKIELSLNNAHTASIYVLISEPNLKDFIHAFTTALESVPITTSKFSFNKIQKDNQFFLQGTIVMTSPDLKKAIHHDK